MTGRSLADQIRALHVETVAATGQRRRLAVEARAALIAALCNRLICRPGCADTAYHWTDADDAAPDGDRFRVAWRHEYEMWLRGHTSAATATTAAEALARVDLHRALAGVDHRLVTVSVTVEELGVDLYLDPDND